MNKLLFLLLISTLLLFGCTEDKPAAKPTPKPSQSILLPQTSPSPIPSKIPPANPINFTVFPIVNVSNVTATIIWGTSLRTDSVIEWDETDKYGNIVAQKDNSTSHKFQITNLKFLTAYHYRISACIGDVCIKSPDLKFTTDHKQCVGSSTYIPDADVCIDNFEATIVSGKAVSQSNSVPASGISRAEAQKACENSGKRLCTSDEFTAACNIKGVKYGPTVGDTNCAIQNSSYVPAGYPTSCVSKEGVHDLIGNFWEWVSDSVTDKTPIAEGLVDRDDILSAGASYVLPRQFSEETEKHGGDYYFNIEPDQNRFIGKGIARGGYYRSNRQAGCFAFQVGVPLEGNLNTGFRCCA
ncbi:SUMF1/EgtB/PvdO family nonheme iron enzyme [Candidatus Micrarchaeota archaeon]|nr:SUMF1/EgtB/PvdO family nonheme iron enzyme [Candidatus Micrarchaeota archaeon]